MKQSFYRLFIELTNNRFTSGLLRRFSTSRLSKLFIKPYIKAFNLNMDESKETSFSSLHALFTRELKQNARPIHAGVSELACPVDGVLESCGKIEMDIKFVVKGKTYSIIDMLGSKEMADKYDEGYYMVLYLSPSHYHRMHSPIEGEVVSQFELGSKSYPVNKAGLTYGKDPLSKNYRIVSEVLCNDNNKHIAMIKVGAMFVNTIVVTKKEKQLKKGEEVGYFSFGSTVVLLFEANSFTPNEKLQSGHAIRVGQNLGKLY
ncbi:phosphatidylserine decarboxylase [Bacillus sp. AFS017336]|uniref:phosphatidylserine decarboxylase n=1 Tax=Bacillus sp. AFS017336 TaxID=2033489 RepID=UPI000BF08BB4|nr:phosphatidylserine decarboxylase [Bacillus sp. AFS017336]PEL14137.1 phosphatidylserine decarboxylase [Bacillus sp. AFS017336]